jgi:hypothetical protein
MALPVVFVFALIAAKNDPTYVRTPCSEAAVATDCLGIPAPVTPRPPPVGRAKASNQYVVQTADPAVSRAGQLLNLSQPSQALDILLAALERHPHDPSVLMLAGLAAYRSDQVRAALGYWRQSLDLAPSEPLKAIYEDARRETAADRSNDKLYSQHFAVRYESAAMPAVAARSILDALEEDYARISAQLGCASSERIVVIVQSREQYQRATSAAEWSGGHYDGRIHVAWDASPHMQRALAHEFVHACLASLPSGSNPWPAWLQEGLAQKLSGDTLQPSAREQLRQLAVTHEIPRLENLGVDWFSMPRQDAVAAYNLSLAAADALYDDYASPGIRKILTNPEALPRITTYLDAQLGL